MSKTRANKIALLLLFLLFFGCGERKEEKSKVQEAVKEAVTKEFKLYEGVKQSLEKIQKDTKEKLEKEANQ